MPFFSQEAQIKNIQRFLIVTVIFYLSGSSLNAQWTRAGAPPGAAETLYSFVVSPAPGGSHLLAATSTGIWRSTDYGASWVNANTGSMRPQMDALAICSNGSGGTYLFAAGYDGVFRSTDDGNSWSFIGRVDSLIHLSAFEVYPAGNGVTNVFVADGPREGFFMTTDTSKQWTHIIIALTTNHVFGLAAFPSGAGGTNLFAVTFGTGVKLFRSTDTGASWAGISDNYIYALALIPDGLGASSLFAGTTRGIFRSIDDGTSWTSVSTGLASDFLLVSAFAYAPNPGGGIRVFAATQKAGVYVSGNNGVSWAPVNDGLTSQPIYYPIYYLAVADDYLIAVDNIGGCWRRPLAEIVVSVERLRDDGPARFGLRQNYPNPFNPSTNISFTIPTRSFVTLRVFDALGREVGVLVSEELPAGSYVRRWDAAGFPSGLYFCRLEAGSLTETRKLLLLR